MRKLLLAGLLCLLGAGSAWADGFAPGERIVRQWGALVTLSATNSALDPGFTADWISICALPSASSYGSVFVRPGKTLAEATTSDLGLVTDAVFQTGTSGSITGRPFVISPSQENTEEYCQLLPWAVDGLVFHTPAGNSVSLDVIFYDTQLF